VLRAAVELADAQGIEAVSMRRLAQELGVEAMSLYNHVANKDEILDGLVETVAEEVEIPSDASDWKVGLRTIALSAREVLLRHRWASSLWMERGTPGPARLGYGEALLRTLREGGFSKELTYDAFHILEALILGVATMHMNLPHGGEFTDMAKRFAAQLPADEYPYLIEHVWQHLEPHPERSGYEFAIDLLIDGLERARDAEADSKQL
jgi:AcrR family transcriptional regulator